MTRPEYRIRAAVLLQHLKEQTAVRQVYRFRLSICRQHR
jgi:hypothetical protein